MPEIYEKPYGILKEVKDFSIYGCTVWWQFFYLVEPAPEKWLLEV